MNAPRSTRVLVTGGAGYLGRHVVEELLAEGHEVWVADSGRGDVPEGSVRATAPLFSDDPEVWKEMGSPDVLVHLAWRDIDNHQAPSHFANLPKHISFIRRIVDGGVRHIVAMGTVHEVGLARGELREDVRCEPVHPYGQAKVALREEIERIAAERGVVFQWARGFHTTGDDERGCSVFTRLLRAAADGEQSFPLTPGDNLLDFQDVSMTAKQLATLVAHPETTGIINCCSGIPVALRSRVERFIAERGLSIRLDLGAYPARPYDSPGVWGDATRIRRLLGHDGVEAASRGPVGGAVASGPS